MLIGKDKIKVNANKIYPFVRWYCDTLPKNRTKENYDKNVKKNTECELDYAMSMWLIKPDVQDAIKEYYKQKRNIRIFNVYDAMYQKALKGDVNASKWIIDFSKSDFFENSKDEMNDYLSNINIPALKKSDK